MKLVLFLLLLTSSYGFLLTSSSKKPATLLLHSNLDERVSDNSKPELPSNSDRKSVPTLIKTIIASSLITASSFNWNPNIALASQDSAVQYSNEYIDNRNKFSVVVPPNWIVMKTKVPTPTLVQYVLEETLFVANNILDGLSISITLSDVPRLLKDFKIDYWFAPFDSLSNIGKPELIARLLILQRQSEFEKMETTSVINKAEISEDGRILMFEFTTPTLGIVRDRETTGITYFRNNKLVTLWVSSSESLSERSSNDGSLSKDDQRQSIINSFKLI